MSLAEVLPYLPATNASLNALSAAFLVAGYICIRRRNIVVHRNFMLAAVATSTLFLASYLTYHFGRAYLLDQGPTLFRDPAWFRPIYLGILLSHTVLAVVILPMVILSVIWGLRNRVEKHKRIARWTWPLWMYVSVTGVLIYLLLYQIFPQA